MEKRKSMQGAEVSRESKLRKLVVYEEDRADRLPWLHAHQCGNKGGRSWPKIDVKMANLSKHDFLQ